MYIFFLFKYLWNSRNHYELRFFFVFILFIFGIQFHFFFSIFCIVVCVLNKIDIVISVLINICSTILSRLYFSVCCYVRNVCWMSEKILFSSVELCVKSNQCFFFWFATPNCSILAKQVDCTENNKNNFFIISNWNEVWTLRLFFMCFFLENVIMSCWWPDYVAQN